MRQIKIAIDGPASSGKSTVAKMLARKLNYTYLDTGAMYRAATYLALQYHLIGKDVDQIVYLLDKYPINFRDNELGDQLVFVGDTDISYPIRDNAITHNVTWVSALVPVRKKLTSIQRHIAKSGSIVMDGRDIGTQVLPDAELKIFLVASIHERAERRYKENLKKGIHTDFESLKKAIKARDYKDSHRIISPLQPARDAIYLDTTGVCVSDVVGFIEEKSKKIIDKYDKTW